VGHQAVFCSGRRADIAAALGPSSHFGLYARALYIASTSKKLIHW
jgi:hypothetical protein